jgi:hypothetical protein
MSKIEVESYKYPKEYEEKFIKMFKYGSYQAFLESTTDDYALIKLKKEVKVEDNNYPVLVPGFRENWK